MCAEAHTCNPSAWEVDEGWSEIQRVSREVTATHKSREANRSFFYLFSLLLCDCEKKNTWQKHLHRRRDYSGMEFQSHHHRGHWPHTLGQSIMVVGIYDKEVALPHEGWEPEDEYCKGPEQDRAPKDGPPVTLPSPLLWPFAHTLTVIVSWIIRDSNIH